ncbi:helix-turn-helix domain-containing protein [Herpetosiphon giganteus]|uniref:helix-turn-helix domain-containing protein n=1 Tax=Herpetosiphon giganteus TaxID=2029754 RepID=UPI00195CAE8A|nr:helix-turn-helix transcriptional regulator [Herpetosiphon giganteus]MBM7845651.1 transcriptional regulator with XRE-family HTH domain [Herpetosiphon giganteus]
MLGLSIILDTELQKRGWRRSMLAAESGVSEPTLSRIMNDVAYIPELKTMAALSKALELPLRRLLEACGFDLDTTTPLDDSQRVHLLMTAVPELYTFLVPLAQLSPDDRQSVITFAEMLAQKHFKT